jgi:hypothetical protein
MTWAEYAEGLKENLLDLHTCRTWTAARENHHAGRSDRLGLGKVRV